jgi:hypothetical protein
MVRMSSPCWRPSGSAAGGHEEESLMAITERDPGFASRRTAPLRRPPIPPARLVAIRVGPCRYRSSSRYMWLLHRALGCGRLFIGRHIRGAVCKTVPIRVRWTARARGRD